MVQACLNGGRHIGECPNVPLTPAALANDAIAAARAGATSFHVHPRDAQGAETLHPDDVAAALTAIRTAAPGLPTGIGTGEWIAPGGTARHAPIRQWQVLPDYVSLNIGEADAPKLAKLLQSKNIPIEAGLWCLADAHRYLAEIDSTACLRILIEMPDTDPATALAEADAILDLLQKANKLPILLHGMGQSAWPCLSRAAALGLASRVGFEDMLHLPNGQPAPDNAALITAALAQEPGLT